MNELTKYGVYMQLNIKELKRNEVLMHDTTWMNLKNIMLSKKRQIQKATCSIIPFTRNVPNRKIYRHRSRSVAARDWRRKERGEFN